MACKFYLGMVQKTLNQSDFEIFKSAIFKSKLVTQCDFFACWFRLKEGKRWFEHFWSCFSDFFKWRYAIDSHGNKKAVSPFYHKKYFWHQMNVRQPYVVLHSFSIKNIFYDKIDWQLFYFHVTKWHHSNFRVWLTSCLT